MENTLYQCSVCVSDTIFTGFKTLGSESGKLLNTQVPHARLMEMLEWTSALVCNWNSYCEIRECLNVELKKQKT